MSRKFFSLILALLMLAASPAALAEDAPVTVVDMYGREITLAETPVRIVALTASNCEILAALGCEELIVGRGAYCNYPESILTIPAVQSGAETNLEEILALDPQVVVMSDMAQPGEQVRFLEENGVQVILTQETDIEGVYYAIRLIGAVVRKDAEAEALVTEMQDAFSRLQSSAAAGKTVYFEVSPLEHGLWTTGKNTFMDEIAQLCGLTNAFSDVEGWSAVSEEQVLFRNPDYIVSISGTLGAEAEIMSRAGWSGITAVASNQVMNADADAFSRPGPRLKDAAISLYNFINGVDPESSAAPAN